MRLKRSSPAASMAAATAAILLAACGRDPPPPDQPPAPPKTDIPPVGPAMIGRAEILAAIAEAASAHAAGLDPGDASAILGRTFSIRLAFGCFGPVEAGESPARTQARDGLANWRWDEGRAAQELRLAPADWTRSPLLIEAGAEPEWERVDGFWIAWPWLRTDACPAAPAPSSAPPDSTQEAGEAEPDEEAPAPAEPFTAGLAAIRPEGASRLGRRAGEPYSFLVRGAAGAPPPAPEDGYRVVLEGRIVAFPGGDPIRCSSDDPNRRPVCIAAVALDRVAFETARGAPLSEWRPKGGR